MTGFIFNSRVAADDRYDAYCFDETGDYIHRILAVYRLIPKVMLKLMWVCFSTLVTSTFRVPCALDGPDKNCEKYFSLSSDEPGWYNMPVHVFVIHPFVTIYPDFKRW